MRGFAPRKDAGPGLGNSRSGLGGPEDSPFWNPKPRAGTGSARASISVKVPPPCTMPLPLPPLVSRTSGHPEPEPKESEGLRDIGTPRAPSREAQSP